MYSVKCRQLITRNEKTRRTCSQNKRETLKGNSCVNILSINFPLANDFAVIQNCSVSFSKREMSVYHTHAHICARVNPRKPHRQAGHRDRIMTYHFENTTMSHDRLSTSVLKTSVLALHAVIWPRAYLSVTPDWSRLFPTGLIAFPAPGNGKQMTSGGQNER